MRARSIGNNSDKKLGPMPSIGKALRRALLRNEVAARPCRSTLGPPLEAARHSRIIGTVDIDLGKVLIGTHLIGVGRKVDLIGRCPAGSGWRDAACGSFGRCLRGNRRRCALNEWDRKL